MSDINEVFTKNVVILDSNPSIYALAPRVLAKPFISFEIVLIDQDTENLLYFGNFLKSCLDLVIVNYHLKTEPMLSEITQYDHETSNVLRLILQFYVTGVPVAVWTDQGIENIRKEHVELLQKQNIDILEKPKGDSLIFQSWLSKKLDMPKHWLDLQEYLEKSKWFTVPVYS